MPLDRFKQSGKPNLPEFEVRTRKNRYRFRQTGSDGLSPVVECLLTNQSILQIKMIVPNVTHPHDWTYSVRISGKRDGYSFGTCDQLLDRLPFILQGLEDDTDTCPTDGPGLTITPIDI